MAFPPAHTGFSWTVPTTNVDGTPIVAGEITGFSLGVRLDGDVSHGPGNYAAFAAAGATATGVTLLAAFGTPGLANGNYWLATQTLSTTNGNSVWSPEVPFSIVPRPNPPGGVAAA